MKSENEIVYKIWKRISVRHIWREFEMWDRRVKLEAGNKFSRTWESEQCKVTTSTSIKRNFQIMQVLFLCFGKFERNYIISREIMEQELEKSLSKIRRNMISSKVGNFWCFPVVADGNLVKGEDFPGARRALSGKIFRLLLNYRQQLRENHQKFPTISRNNNF